jgi:hypothetical protein
MEIPLLSEFLEIIQKLEVFQSKIFEKNKLVSLLSLKAIIKVLEKFLETLKKKEQEIQGKNLETIISGINIDNIKKIKNFLVR